MKSYRIGRGHDVDIVLPHGTVGRLHAELIESPDGRYFLTDLNSTNGTFSLVDKGWQRLDKGYVRPEQPVRLGDYETSARELIARVSAHRRAPAVPPEAPSVGGPKGRVERNPATGEIVERKK